MMRRFNRHASLLCGGVWRIVLVGLGALVMGPSFPAHAVDGAVIISVISEIEQDIVDHMCQDKGFLQCFSKGQQGDCRTLMGKVVRPCLEDQLKHAPMGLELGTALMYTVKAKNCFNKRLTEVLGEKREGASCEEAPGHLQ